MSGGLLVAMRRWAPPGALAQEESRGGLPLHRHESLISGFVRPAPLLEKMSTVYASTSSQSSSKA